MKTVDATYSTTNIEQYKMARELSGSWPLSAVNCSTYVLSSLNWFCNSLVSQGNWSISFVYGEMVCIRNLFQDNYALNSFVSLYNARKVNSFAAFPQCKNGWKVRDFVFTNTAPKHKEICATLCINPFSLTIPKYGSGTLRESYPGEHPFPNSMRQSKDKHWEEVSFSERRQRYPSLRI